MNRTKFRFIPQKIVEITDETIVTLVECYINKKNKLPSFLQNVPIGDWDVSRVTDMSNLFQNCSTFNEPIFNWNTSNVTNMKCMFDGAKLFNQSINTDGDKWNVSNVTNMNKMFRYANNFNKSIENWNTSNVTDMESMFENALSFNQPINTNGQNWNVSNVTDMNHMFSNAVNFNQPINNWNTSNVTNMKYMFKNATNYNQPMNTNGNKWNVSNVEYMSYMFNNARSFNQPLTNWNVSNVQYMNSMFEDAINFRTNPHWNLVNVHPSQIFHMLNGSGLAQMGITRIAPLTQVRAQAVMPQGVAYEIHNAFESFKFKKFMRIIREENVKTPVSESVFERSINTNKILLSLKTYVNEFAENKEEKIRQLTIIENNVINLTDYLSNKQNIIDVLKFIMAQPKEVIDTYITILLTDCLKAYSSGRAESCVKGMFERIFYSVRDTVSTFCLDKIQNSGSAPLCKPVYIELYNCFYEVLPKEGSGGLNELMQEWISKNNITDIKNMNSKDKIESFVEFVRRFINNNIRFGLAEKSIRDYAISEIDNVLQYLGGKKRKTKSLKKTNKIKKTKKKYLLTI